MDPSSHQSNSPGPRTSPLKRGLNLTLLTLYGLGVTIGAGIYVLVGAVAAEAGTFAPIAFMVAAAGVAFTAFSYAELATRYPVAAGEAAYVRAGFNSRGLSLLVGLMITVTGVVSSAAVSIGGAAYLRHFVPIPTEALTTLIILVLGAGAVWGIVESIVAASILTLVEIGGLGLAIYQGVSMTPDMITRLDTVVPPLEAGAWTGILAASVIAFFAFIGFEDIVNVAEEVKNPTRTLPRAIVLTLLITTILYIIVVSVAVLALPLDELAGSPAPLALLFGPDAEVTGDLFNGIAAAASINGVLVQIIMASRVLYGLAAQGSVPARLRLAYVSPSTRTPVIATTLVAALSLSLALLFPIAELAAATSQVVLLVFAIVNIALWRVQRETPPADENVFRVPRWVPAAGAVASMTLLIASVV